MRARIAAGGAAAVALLALVAGLRTPSRGQVTIAARLPTPVTAAPALPVVADLQARPEPAPAAARDLTPKALVEHALQSENLQLRTQAYLLLRHCALVLAPGRIPPLVSPSPWMARESVPLAEQAWQAMARRCESLRDLPQREVLQRRLDPVPAFAADAADPLQADGRWLTGTFEQHGGTALLWAGDTLAAYLEERTGRSDGDLFETLDAEAIDIARCRFGADCAADSSAAQAACITLGACDGDVQQRLLSTLGSRAARERVTRQAEALTQALRNGDLGRYGLGQGIAR